MRTGNQHLIICKDSSTPITKKKHGKHDFTFSYTNTHTSAQLNILCDAKAICRYFLSLLKVMKEKLASFQF